MLKRRASALDRNGTIPFRLPTPRNPPTRPTASSRETPALRTWLSPINPNPIKARAPARATLVVAPGGSPGRTLHHPSRSGPCPQHPSMLAHVFRLVTLPTREARGSLGPPNPTWCAVPPSGAALPGFGWCAVPWPCAPLNPGIASQVSSRTAASRRRDLCVAWKCREGVWVVRHDWSHLVRGEYARTDCTRLSAAFTIRR